MINPECLQKIINFMLSDNLEMVNYTLYALSNLIQIAFNEYENVEILFKLMFEMNFLQAIQKVSQTVHNKIILLSAS